MKKRIDRLEHMGKNKKYLPIVVIDAGEPLPANVGPDTVVIVDNIPKKPITIQGS